MKTSSAAIRVWKLRLACLAIVATAAFDLWAVRYCCSNLGKAATQQTGTQQVWNGSVTGSELFLAIR
jgi:hypothetical protein